MRNQQLFIALLIISLVTLRVFLGANINFAHPDYEQIYLIGLEHATSKKWSYWGPDVVWSKTRLAGAMQGLLAGVPLALTNVPIAPLIASNLISALGLILLALYSKKRFPSIPLRLLLSFFLLLPFTLFNGVVLLNTAYLIFAGALLFIVVFDLFLYRDEHVMPVKFHFMTIGFALLFTYQLHLTWVMFLPFILVLFYLEHRRKESSNIINLCFLCIGALLGGITLIPTLWEYGHVMFQGTGGNLTFEPSRFGAFFDLLIRYLGVTTFDFIHTRNYVELITSNYKSVLGLVWTMKVIGILQFALLCIAFYKLRNSNTFRRTALLFGLTLLMCLALYVLGNKHLSIRTYILVYPIPIWLALLCYDKFKERRFVQPGIKGALLVATFTTLIVAVGNTTGPFAIESSSDRIKQALEARDPSLFGVRRKTLMDPYD